MFSRIVLRQFGFRVKANSIIAPSKGYIPQLTRADLKRKIETPNIDAEIASDKRIQEEKKFKKMHFSMPANDSNPANLIQNLRVVRSEEVALFKPVPKIDTIPETIIYRRNPKAPFVQGRLGRCKGSVKKITPVMRKIRGLHVEEALELMQNDHSRAGERIHTALKMVLQHAIQKGLSQIRLYVKDAITNRQRRVKGMRYHAKMRRGLEKRDWCSLLIRLEEKPASEFFKDLVSGNAPVSVSRAFKQKVLESQNPLESIQKYQFILTSKGKQQRREMIKRKAYNLQQKLRVGGMLK